MSNRLFSTSGTLLGVQIPIDIQVLTTGFTPGYVEVHNHSPVNDYTVVLQGQSFYLPAGRKLGIPGPVAKLELNGTGLYSIYGGESKTLLPSLDSIQQGSIGGGTVSPPDNITLEDTGAVLQVKNLGIANAKLANANLKFRNADTGILALPGTPAIDRIQCLGLPIDGETLRVVLGAYDTTFTWKNVKVLPTDIQIGIGPGSCALELAACLNADAALTAIANITQLPLSAGPAGNVVLTSIDYANIQLGWSFANSSTSANVTIQPEAGVAEGLAGVSYVQHTVTVDDVAQSCVVLPCAGYIASWSMFALRTGLAPEPVPLPMTGSTVQVNPSTLVYYDNYGAYSLTAGDVILAVLYTRL